MVIDVSASGHYVGDCRDLLARLPEGCVQTCVTSPPYWGLRDYGTAKWEGGDSDCDHRESKPERTAACVASSTLGVGKGSVHASHVFRGDCGRCGAVRVDRQIGLEETPEQYVAALVEVFRGVRRALRDDGTLWLNLGDSYASIAGGYDATGSRGSTATVGANTQSAVLKGRRRLPPAGLKPKDLVGIPWRVAFALQADGWYLRSEIIWAKPNPMPESVTDRPTKSHEHVFLLSKSERYLYDAAAVAERAVWPGQNRKNRDAEPTAMPGAPAHRGLRQDKVTGTRNLRDVWHIATQPYKGAHFAVMPPALVEPCILAGSRPGDLVLDPFFGSGTVGEVAEKHGRRWIGFDLSPAYEKLQAERTAQRSLVLGGSNGSP